MAAFIVRALCVLLAEAVFFRADSAAGCAVAIAVLGASLHANRPNTRDLSALKAGRTKSLKAGKAIASKSDRAICTAYPNTARFLIDA